MNKNQKNVRFCFFSWFFKNCELIKDSSLWHSNFILSVCDSVIIIRSRSVTYIFGSRFIYNRWVRVSIEIWILAFLGKYSNIFVGSQSVSIEVRINYSMTQKHKREKFANELMTSINNVFILDDDENKNDTWVPHHPVKI